MTEFSKKQNNNEITELTKTVSAFLPIIQSINENNLNNNIASNQISQTVASWDLTNQIAGLTAFFGEVINTQNGLLQSYSDIFNANILSSFALNNELYRTQTDSLNTNLLGAFAAQDTLQQSLLNTINGNITVSFLGLNNAFISSVFNLQNVLTNLTFESTNKIVESFNGLKKLIGLGIEDIKECIDSDVKTPCGRISKKLTKIYNFMKNPSSDFYTEIKKSITSDEATNLAKKANQLSEKANKLAKEGNALTLYGNTLTTASLVMQAADIVITALTTLEPISKATNIAMGAAAIAAAASLFTTGVTFGAFVADTFATGGFPSMGQMFIAREAGPELVGTIGSRNAVVNNDQIVESVSAGVYKAVREAMNGGQANGQKAVITLDKRVLGEFTIGYINGKTKETGLSPILV
ncbi:MAG: hypothetical protein IJA13_04685 [Clostridia bacterium]|nr:hypothetical protein [Clostridia bacterium]MBQ3562824.1 hypothetical protein [Clostridia bacterium]